MSNAVKSILAEFERLTTEDRLQVATEILRRTPLQDYGALTDDELTSLADESFLALDESEETP